MNTILCNNQVLAIDLNLDGFAGMHRHDPDTFMTPYGLVYPIEGGWNVLRLLKDATSVEDLSSADFIRHYLGNAPAKFAYLDWNGRVWIMSLSSCLDKSITTFTVMLPQMECFAFYSRQVDYQVLSATNSALRDVKGLKNAITVLRKATNDTYAAMHCIELKNFIKNKPKGAVNLPLLTAPALAKEEKPPVE